jgi:uncharacterized protein
VNAFDVRDLLDAPGASRRLHVREPVGGLRLELAAVRDDAPLDTELLLESVVEGILASGRVAGPLTLTCARCLKPFEGSFDLELRELFVRHPDPEGDEYPISAEGSLDAEPMIRDAVLLAMPFSPLCRSGCLGLCERCGGDRNLGECTCVPETADPRWAALDALFPDS